MQSQQPPKSLGDGSNRTTKFDDLMKDEGMHASATFGMVSRPKLILINAEASFAL